MFIESGELKAEKYPAKGLKVSDIDLPYFRDFYESQYEPWDDNPLPLARLMENMNLATDALSTLQARCYSFQSLISDSQPSSRKPSPF